MERTNALPYLYALMVVGVLLVSASGVSASIVFSEYDTTATIQEDSILVEREVTIRNTGQSPIIPGEMHFRFSEQVGDSREAIQVTNVQAQSATGESLTTRSVSRGSEQDVSVQIWNPLLPGFDYQFSMQYEISFDLSGVLFYEINLPQEQTTVPIVNEQTTFVLGDGYHVTYAPETQISSLSGNTVVEWSGDVENRVLEYSRLPFPRTGLRGVNVFWISVIIALLAVFAVSFVKKRRVRAQRSSYSGGQV